MGANKMFNIKSRKIHDDYDTDQLWRRFRNEKDATYFNIPTLKETREIYKLLKSDKKEMYTVDFDECEAKRFYWEKVRDTYIKNDFIIPHSLRLGKELKFCEIWDYHVTDEDIAIVKKIIEILKEEADDYFLKEHVSYT